MSPQVTIHGFNTPHTKKVSVLLEELGVEYDTKKVDLGSGEQRTPEFKSINIIGKVPAIVDHTPEGDVNVVDSNAILFYLADKYDKEGKFTFAPGTQEYYEYIQWLITITELGTIGGVVFGLTNFTPDKSQSAIDFAKTRTVGLLESVDSRLSQQAEKYSTSTPFLVGNKYTAVDIATYTIVLMGDVGLNIDMSNLKALQEFRTRISQRENVKKGYSRVEGI